MINRQLIFNGHNPAEGVRNFFDLGEWWDGVMNNMCKSMYDGMFSVADSWFKGMFDDLNGMITDSSTYITQSPEQWNATGFAFIRSIAENICIPIAGCMITFVFCLELVHLVQENNQMHPITPERIMLVLIKLCIFLYIASKSFDIVMGIFDIGSWASAQVNSATAGELGNIKLKDILSEPDNGQYGFAEVFGMLANMLLILFARVIVYILAAAIFIKVNLWYMELLIYMSASPIPMSTFLHREWGQIGNNYVRKIIAVSFEGFFMLIAFGLYSALVTNLAFSTDDNFLFKLALTIGCGAALFFTLCKSGNISSSVFNAH